MNKASRRTAWVILSLVVLAGLVAVGLPPFIRSRINAGLADMKEGYVGHVEQVTIQWLTPGVTLHELRVERPKHKVGIPFLVVQQLQVEVLFRSFLEPRIGLRFVEPAVNLVDGPTDAEDQWGPPFTLENLREKLPFDLGYAQLAEMQLHFRNIRARPQVDAYLHQVEMTASPLDNCIKNPPQGCDARVDLEGKLMKGAGVKAQARMSYDLKFVLDGTARIRSVALRQLNPVLIKYAEFDIQKGSLDLDGRFRMRGPRYHMTLLPDFEDLEVMGGERDKTKAGREMMIAMVSGIVERRDERWSIVIDGVKGKDNLKWELERRDKSDKPAAKPDAADTPPGQIETPKSEGGKPTDIKPSKLSSKEGATSPKRAAKPAADARD